MIRLLMASAILVGALLVDRLFGEPENRFHPVAWMGSLIARLWKIRPGNGGHPGNKRREKRLFLHGAAITIAGALLFALPLILIKMLVFRLLPGNAALVSWLVLSVILLKPVFSLTKLLQVGAEIAGTLQKGDLPRARELTAHHLVSRPTGELDEAGIAAAVIESLAENLGDSVTSPLFWYSLAALPGAWAFRYINTCDAMLGYRNGDFEWGGKFPARLDDILNFIPARLTGWAILLASPGRRGDVRPSSLKALPGMAGVTESPNAGYPLAAAALALSVKLEKRGHYVVNPGGRAPGSEDIFTIISFIRRSLVIIVPVMILLAGLLHG